MTEKWVYLFDEVAQAEKYVDGDWEGPSVLAGETLERREREGDGLRQWYLPCRVDVENTTAGGGSQYEGDQAVTNNYTLRVWQDDNAGTARVAYFNSDGVEIDVGVVTTGTKCKVRSVGDFLHLYFIQSGNLRVSHIEAGVSTSFTTETVITGVSNELYDVAVDYDNGKAYAVASLGASGYKIQEMAEDGVAVPTATKTVSGAGVSVSIGAAVSNAKLAIAYYDGDDTLLDWVNIDATFTDLEMGITILLGDPPLNNLTVACTPSNDKAFVLYDIGTTPVSGPTDYLYPRVHLATHVQGDGNVLTEDQGVLRGYKLASRAYYSSFDSREHILYHAVYAGLAQKLGGGGLQPNPSYSTNRHYLLLDANAIDPLDGGTISETSGAIARTLPGTAFAFVETTLENQWDNTGFLPELMANSGVLRWCAMFERDIFRAPNLQQQVSEWGLKEISYMFSTNTIPRIYSETLNSVEYLPGGFLAQYDGLQITESGFFQYPEQVVEGANDAAGSLIAGDYQYRFYWQWRNAKGQLERSTSTISYDVNIATGNFGPTFYIPNLGCTLKDRADVQLVVFRTLEGPGSIFYRCSSTDPTDATYVKPDFTSDYITWVDQDYSTDVSAHETDTVFNSGALDSIPANAPQILSGGQYRLFYTQPEDDNRVYFSLLTDYQETPGFNEALILAVPESGGKITGVEAGEDAIYIFKERAVYVASGTGPDNIGNGAYGTPRIISENVGCRDTRSIIRVPAGLLFLSEKGFYLVDRGFSLRYVGGPTDEYKSNSVFSAIHQSDSHRVLFFQSSRILMYDYLVDEWAVWTIGGRSAALCGDTAYWSNGTTKLYKASTGYTDDSVQYDRVITTDWIPLNGIVGYGRARRWGLLGEFKDDNATKVEVGYDREPAWVDEEIIDFSNEDVAQESYTAGDRVHPRRRFSRQKVTAVRFRISDTTYADSGTGSPTAVNDTITLNGLSLEVGIKRGVVKTGQDDNTTEGS